MNTVTQIQDKTTKNLKDESKTNRRQEMKRERE